MAETATGRIIRFGVFEVDLPSGELRRKGLKVKLQGQPFQVLVTLLERRGEVVAREELRVKLWPADTFVDFDHSLNAAVKRLREALGDSAEAPIYVETLARRGYRFIGNVDTQTADQSSLPEPKTAPANAHRSWTSWWPLGVAMLALVIAGVAVAWFFRRQSSQSNMSRPLAALQRLTTNPTQNGIIASAISPDGKYLAYSDRTGMYLRLLSTGEPHVLLPKISDVSSIAWFPEGSQLLASWAVPPEKKPLWALSILSGIPRQLSEEGWAASVSPDGSQIVFLKGADFAEMGREIWVMRSNGADQRKLVSFPEGQLALSVWSPDGRWIAYEKVEPRSDGWGIELFNLEKGTTRSSYRTHAWNLGRSLGCWMVV